MGDENKDIYIDQSHEERRSNAHRQWEDSQEDFYKSIIRNQQDDIGRIGRYFRDELAQELYGMRISLQNFTNLYGDFEELRSLRDSLANLVIELRNKAVLLYNPLLSDLGIFHAIDEVIASYKQRLGLTIDIILDPHLKELHHYIQVQLFKLLTALFEYLKDEMSTQTVSISVQLIDFSVFIKILPYFQQERIEQNTKSIEKPMRLLKIVELYNARIISHSLEKGILLQLTI